MNLRFAFTACRRFAIAASLGFELAYPGAYFAGYMGRPRPMPPDDWPTITTCSAPSDLRLTTYGKYRRCTLLFAFAQIEAKS